MVSGIGRGRITRRRREGNNEIHLPIYPRYAIISRAVLCTDVGGILAQGEGGSMKRSKNKSMVELLRDMCPSKNCGFTSLTISCEGKEIVTLTEETRKKLDDVIKNKSAQK